jgi:hypothetical protein
MSNSKEVFDLLDFARASAATAFDQKGAWEDSRATYFDDVRSTIEDHKITDPLLIQEAEALYNSECDRLWVELGGNPVVLSAFDYATSWEKFQVFQRDEPAFSFEHEFYGASLKERVNAAKRILARKNATKVAHWGPAFETFLPAGLKDDAGREIGYVIGLRDNGIKFYAWVQNARRKSPSAKWHFFGAGQRSREFDTQEQATAWAYSTARNRIANLKKGK